MKQVTKKILDMLTERGYRITRARAEICDILASLKRPLTIQEIIDKTASDETSVYRFISMLTQEKLVEKITVRNDVSRYALAFQDHHHHVICTGCGFIAHISCEHEPNTPKRIQEFSQIDDHEITFYGVCQKCT